MSSSFTQAGLVAGCVTLSFSTLVQAVEFRGLGDLPGGESHSSTWAISADGLVVVGTASSAARPESGSNEAFVWTQETGMVGLGFHSSEDNYSIGRGVSADGKTVVGGGSSATGNKAIRWTLGEGMQDLGVVEEDPASHPVAEATSHDGRIVTGQDRWYFTSSHSVRAFVWTEESGMSYLPPVPWMDEQQKLWARDITSDGSVIAGNSKIGNFGWGEEGFLWSSEQGYTHIEPAGDIVTTDVRAVSDDGTTVVGGLHHLTAEDQLKTGAMWWRADVGVVDVGGLRGNESSAFFYDISGSGQVAVGQDWLPASPPVTGTLGTLPISYHPIIWDEYHGVRNVEQMLIEEYGMAEELDGWKLERAFAVSHDGLTIVGGGLNPQGNVEAWRVVLDGIPAPDLVPGDANLDGQVDFADFLRLAANFDTGAFWYQGDFDGNYRVDLDDFFILAGAFRRTSAAAVPEPAFDVVIWLAIAITALRPFRQR